MKRKAISKRGKVIPLGVVLDAYRYQERLTYKELSNAIGIPSHAVTSICKGRRTNSDNYRVLIIWLLSHRLVVG